MPLLDHATKQLLLDEQTTWKGGQVIWGAFAAAVGYAGGPPIVAALAGLVAVHAKLKSIALDRALQDPPRRDYSTRTIPRPRRFLPEALGDGPLEWRTVEFCLAVLDANAYLEAMVRAEERAMGARADGAYDAADRREGESVRFATETPDRDRRVAHSARSLAESFEKLADFTVMRGTSDFDTIELASAPLAEMLPTAAVDLMWSSGVRKDDLDVPLTHGLALAGARHDLQVRTDAIDSVAVEIEVPRRVTAAGTFASLRTASRETARVAERGLQISASSRERREEVPRLASPPRRARRLTFELRGDAVGSYGWLLRAPSEQPIAESPRRYASKRAAIDAARWFRDNAERLSFDIYSEPGTGYRWRAIGPDQETIAESTRAYGDERAARQSVQGLRLGGLGQAVLPV